MRNDTIIETFLAIVLLAVLALFASSPRFLRLRRSRPATLLLSGGWLAVAAGALVGPSGLGAVDQDAMIRLTPLLMIGLGWIGVMVGLQADLDLLKRLPGALWGLAAVDVLVSVLVFGSVAAAALSFWVVGAAGELRAASVALGVTLLAACSIGWSMETRSLRRGPGAESERLAMLIRGGGSLSAMAAIILFGIGSKAVDRSDAGEMVFAPGPGAVRVTVALSMAIMLGLLGRYALRLAGRRRSELLAVFLGLVALLGGMSVDLGFSPLLAALLAGAVIANLSGKELRQFNRFILEAEHVVALLFALLAGVLIDPNIGPWGLGLAVAIAALRLMVKPLLLRGAARFLPAPAETDAAPPLPDAGRKRRERLVSAMLRVAPVRQGPLAIALAVGLVLLEPSAFSQRLLTVVVLAGLISEMLPLLLSSIGASAPASDEEAPAPAGQGATA